MKKSLVLSTVLAASAVAFAQTPQKINVKGLPSQATLVDNVVVPVPSEVFGALDKMGRPTWEQVLRTTKDQAVGESQPQIALQLGLVIAEGFIAVEAQNTEEVKKIGATVQKLSKALGVEQHVTKHANAILKNADAKDWVAVRKELDRTSNDVRKAMLDLGSEPLSQLISLGGWLRGTEAVTDVVSKDYSAERAELLHQPMLLDYFQKRLASMPANIKKNPLIEDMQKGMLEIRPLVGLEGAQISERSVKDVGTVAGRLVKSINAKIN